MFREGFFFQPLLAGADFLVYRFLDFLFLFSAENSQYVLIVLKCGVFIKFLFLFLDFLV